MRCQWKYQNFRILDVQTDLGYDTYIISDQCIEAAEFLNTEYTEYGSHSQTAVTTVEMKTRWMLNVDTIITSKDYEDCVCAFMLSQTSHNDNTDGTSPK